MRSSRLIRLTLALMLLVVGCKKKSTGSPTLHQAARAGDIEQVQKLLARWANVNAKDWAGDTPLHEAAQYGRKNVAELLIKRSAYVNAKNKDNDTPLHIAACYGHKATVILLIAHGADINIKNKFGETPLYNSTKEHHKDITLLLIDNGADVNAKGRFSGESPIFYATKNGDKDMVELLIAKGANVIADCRWDNITLLHLAALYGYKDLIELFIAKGIDINAKNDHGDTPLHFAAGAGREDTVELLLTKGADINAKNNHGETPIVSAARCSKQTVAELLFTKGANLNATEQGLKWLLFFTAHYGLKDIAEQLINKNPNSIDVTIILSGPTQPPLWEAISNGQTNVAELFIANGADINTQFYDGNRLLHEAVRKGHSDIVELLIAYDADVNVKNQFGKIPLHYAVSGNNKNIIMLLLANGADINAKDNDGDTPLHTAALRGYKDVVEMLINHGADVMAKDCGGLTPIDEATRRRHNDIIEFLKTKTTSANRTSEYAQKSLSHEAGPSDKETVKSPSVTTSDPNLKSLTVQRVQLSDAAIAQRYKNTLAKDNSIFAINLYQSLCTSEGNLFFSPYSISEALAMAYAGARGNTETQMAKTLQFSLDQENLHPVFAGLRSTLNKLQVKDSIKLNIANSLWPQQGYPLLDDYKSLVERYYDTYITPVNYFNASESARQTINKSIEDKTEQKIKEALPSGLLDAGTLLVLVNAIYLKGNWEYKFDPNNTQNAPFYISPHKQVQVPMMNQTEMVKYADTNSMQILELPYKGSNFSMLVLLPKEIGGITQLEKSLSAENLMEWRDYLYKWPVHFFLPKFKMTCLFRLDKTLQDMGMIDAFQGTANFAGMTGNRDLFITFIIHKAYVDVNEEGTEAAAATAGGFGGSPPPPAVFRADHPFLFLIQENKTGSILFIGRVTDPTKNE